MKWRFLHEDETLRERDTRFRSKLTGDTRQITTQIYLELLKEFDLEEFKDITNKVIACFNT